MTGHEMTDEQLQLDRDAYNSASDASLALLLFSLRRYNAVGERRTDKQLLALLHQ